MTTQAFGDEVALFYEKYMVPMVFQPYADDLAQRVTSRSPGDVLETAAGTGVVTRKLASAEVHAPRSMTVTDLSQSMLELNKKLCPRADVRFSAANAGALPFSADSFDTVVCQFGVMFFPDRPHAYGEARRVLRPGGRFLFSTWDRRDTNDFANIAEAALSELLPSNRPSFLARVPHGYYDVERIERDLLTAGFDSPVSIEAVVQPSRAASARVAAEAFVLGTPLRGELEESSPGKLEAAVEIAERALLERFGSGAIEGSMRAFVVEVVR